MNGLLTTGDESGHRPTEDQLKGVIPALLPLWDLGEVTLNSPLAFPGGHMHSPEETHVLQRKHTVCGTPEKGVGGTRKAGGVPSDSHRIYLLRAYHYKGIFVGSMRWTDIGLNT
jgi:hypothetical protein